MCTVSMRAGLDSTSSAQLVDILASLSAAGVNIIFSIHQPRPDILRHMDSLLLLSPVGQLVYCGSLEPLPAHLAALSCPQPPGTLNIADFLLDVVISASPRRLAALVDGFERSALGSGGRRRACGRAARDGPGPAATVRAATACAVCHALPPHVPASVPGGYLLRRDHRHRRLPRGRLLQHGLQHPGSHRRDTIPACCSSQSHLLRGAGRRSRPPHACWTILVYIAPRTFAGAYAPCLREAALLEAAAGR